MTKAWWFRALLSLILSVCLIAVLLTFGSWSETLSAMGRVSLIDSMAWFGLYGLLLLLRTVRFRLLQPRHGFFTVLRAIAVQGGANRVMPFRLGELTLPYLIQQREPQSSGGVLFVLGWIRIAELFVLILATMTAIFVHTTQIDEHISLWIGIALLLGLIVAMTLVQPEHIAVRLSRFLLRLAPLLVHVSPKLENLWRGLCQEMASLPPIDRGARWRLILMCLCVQACIIGLYAHMLHAFDLNLSLVAMVIGIGAAQLASLLPILTIGTVGLHESGWVAGFVWLGVGVDAAVSSGLLTQAFTLVLGLVWAGLFYGLFSRRPTGKI